MEVDREANELSLKREDIKPPEAISIIIIKLLTKNYIKNVRIRLTKSIK